MRARARSYPKFFSVYLEDWRVKAGDQPSGQRKQAGEALLTKGDAAGEQASPIGFRSFGDTHDTVHTLSP